MTPWLRLNTELTVSLIFLTFYQCLILASVPITLHVQLNLFHKIKFNEK